MDKAAAETLSLTASVTRTVCLLEATPLRVLSTIGSRDEIKLSLARQQNTAVINKEFPKKT